MPGYVIQPEVGRDTALLTLAHQTVDANGLLTPAGSVDLYASIETVRLSNAVVTVKGTASDNARVTGVWYQFNGAAWNSASSTNGWTNWMATVGLIKGTNVVRAYSVDTSGNASITNSISFVSSNAFTLHLGVSSSHSMTNGGPDLSLDVSPGLNGRIEASTNLVNWTTLTNFVSTNSVIYFRDPGFTNCDRRFYRAMVP